MTAPIVWVNPVTQNHQVDALGPDGQNHGIAAAGWSATVTGTYDTGTVAIWFPAGRRPRYLRQRQSPAGSPARLLGPQLRQRQTLVR